jgi:hypothetical protein
MEIYRDFKELLELFNAQKVEYVIVGGHALAFHGHVRATKDIDLYVRAERANAGRVMAALEAFGFGQTGLHAADFEKPDQIIQLGFPPVRIDIITSIEGVSWEQAAGGKAQGEYGGEPVPFIGRAELIANKRAAGRPQDLADVAALQSMDKDRPKRP